MIHRFPAVRALGPPDADHPVRRPHRAVVAALFASLLAHGGLLVALSERGPSLPPVTAPPALVTRLAPLPQPVVQVPDVTSSAVASTPPQQPSPSSAAPLRRIVVPQRGATTTWVDVTVAPDVEPAIEAPFEQTLRRDLPDATRVPLEFETAPVVRLAPEIMGERTQRMLRALVRINPRGEIDLVQTNEYDVPYMDAIREALAGARAPASADERLRWAVVVFWFHRVGEAVTK